MGGRIPAVGKEAKRYDALAEWARARGYPRLSGSTVHSWVKRGLPLPVIDDRPGFGQRTTSEPDETYANLLLACRYRYDYAIPSIGVVGALMWLDGAPVTVPLVREGLIFFASNPIRLLRLLRQRPDVQDPSNIAALAEAAGVAFAYHPELADRFPTAKAVGFDRADLAVGGSDLVRLMMGVPTRPDPAGVRALATLLDAEDSFSADALRQVAATRLRPPVLIRRIRRISPRSLERARGRTLERLAEANTDNPVAAMIGLLAEVAVGHLAHSG